MRFGIFYEHQLPRPWNEGDEERLLLNALEQVELADRVGFDYVWEVEHHFLEEYSHSSAPEVFLAAASQRTKNIRLGHGIVQLPAQFNHPTRVAERIATLDLISGGRVDFGTGESSSQAELGGFGVPRGAKRAQWEESIGLVSRLMTEEPFTGYRGRWVDVPPRNVVPKPKQKPHPPLWVACSRRETIELAARRGIGALSFSFVDPDDARPWVESYYRLLASEECVPAGMAVNPNLAVVLPLMIHQDEQTAIDRGIDGAHFFGYSLAHYYVFGNHYPGRTNIWEEFEKFRGQRGFARDLVKAESQPLSTRLLLEGIGSLRGAVGTPEQVAELLQRYKHAGVDQVIFAAQCGRNQHEHVCESLELFGKEVLPRFAEGRDEEEAAKRERLAPVVAAALARKPAPPVRDVSNYVISPAGELSPARAPRLDARPASPRRLVERRVQAAVGSVMSAVPDRPLGALATSGPALLAFRKGMERLFDSRSIGKLHAALAIELSLDGKAEGWTVQVGNGRVRSVPGVSRDADAVLRMAAADFVRLISGQLPPSEAIFDDRILIDGDVAKAMAVLEHLQPAGNLF
jgi:alkanesulfonate monooxygenase SsuD/methylene tetrahydromethanopterin reductase-like flavin-dependent oxidoreductase (luciferase family)